MVAFTSVAVAAAAWRVVQVTARVDVRWRLGQELVMQLKHLRTLLNPQVRSCAPLPSPACLNVPSKVRKLKFNDVDAELLLCAKD